MSLFWIQQYYRTENERDDRQRVTLRSVPCVRDKGIDWEQQINGEIFENFNLRINLSFAVVNRTYHCVMQQYATFISGFKDEGEMSDCS
jgi:hypothetical protein